MKEPFDKDEKEVMNLLLEAHNKFAKLNRTHDMEILEWCLSFHKLQDLMGSRVLRRDYPETFWCSEGELKS